MNSEQHGENSNTCIVRARLLAIHEAREKDERAATPWSHVEVQLSETGCTTLADVIEVHQHRADALTAASEEELSIGVVWVGTIKVRLVELATLVARHLHVL